MGGPGELVLKVDGGCEVGIIMRHDYVLRDIIAVEAGELDPRAEG